MSLVFTFFFVIKSFNLILLIQYIIFLATRDNLNIPLLPTPPSLSLLPSLSPTYEVHLPYLINSIHFTLCNTLILHPELSSATINLSAISGWTSAGYIIRQDFQVYWFLVNLATHSTKLVQVMKTYSVKRIQELTRKHLSKDKTYKCKWKHRLEKQRAIPVVFLRQHVHSCFTNSLPLLLKLKRISNYVS